MDAISNIVFEYWDDNINSSLVSFTGHIDDSDLIIWSKRSLANYSEMGSVNVVYLECYIITTVQVSLQIGQILNKILDIALVALKALLLHTLANGFDLC